ncbi:hypothetical protein [Paenibacillus sp. OV219]|uniref:hypothetical protein n=1 Tax=Paenibacillus sp. OV219 TaxID=1884377 RepID=UPI00116051FF|nr:hypothetical protein [Paenibacillus sp. OV219]
MKYKKGIIIVSVLVNIILFTYVYLNVKHIKDAYSHLSFGLQGDLVQLESTIDYQIKNNWQEANMVLEKIEDIREDINYLMVTGKDSGLMSKSQENDLWNLYRYFSKYPTYTGYPNTNLNNNQKEELTKLKDDLRAVGWGMNLGYHGDWDSFSMRIDALIK